MSWDGYIDNLVAHSTDTSGISHVDKACIIGLDGGSGWTTSAHAKALQLDSSEACCLAKALKNNDFSTFQSNGVLCEGTKYQFLRVDPDGMVLGKKKDKGSITVAATKTAVVVAHTKEGCQQGNANKAVMVIVDYLKGLNL